MTDAPFDPKRFKFKHLPRLLIETYKKWNAQSPFRLSAALAYYAILALPAFLIVIINTVGLIWGNDIVEGRLTDEISAALGQDTAKTIETIIANTQNDHRNTLSTIIGIGTLIFGASGIFYQLQLSLNTIWGIRVDPQAGLKKFILDRVISFGFVLAIGFLLLISFMLTTAISLFTHAIAESLGETAIYLSFLLDITLSLSIITLLFALMFKYLPDARIEWRTVWIGAFITAILFVLGKFLLGLYFGKANPGSTYGAAGSVILVLLWVSYSAVIFFFGAEFTYIYAKYYGIKIRPNSNAIRIETREIIVDKGEDIVKKDRKKNNKNQRASESQHHKDINGPDGDQSTKDQ